MKNLVLKKAAKADCSDIWLWRNHPEARKNFFNKEPVSWKEHRKWFGSKIKDTRAKMYIAKSAGAKVGIIRFERENNCARVSINLNPVFFGRGLGAEVITLGTEMFYREVRSLKPVIAEVKKDNPASLRSFEKAGYVIKSRGKKKIIYGIEFQSAPLKIAQSYRRRRFSCEKTRKLTSKNRKIYLRPLERGDINKKYLSWLNDREITKYMDTRHSTKKELEEFYDRVSKSKNEAIFAIIKGNTHIGNIKLGINRLHRYADLGIMIGEKRYWGKGCGQEACELLLEYAFKVLNLNKVILGVYGNHKSAIRAYKKSGFKIEGRIRKLLDLEGKYVDKVFMGILREEFLKRL